MYEPSAYGGSDPVPLSEELTPCWNRFQDVLCPSLAELLGPLTANHQRLIAVLDLAPPETFVRGNGVFSPGRPQHSRIALARSFMAKAVYNLATTRALIDRVQSTCCGARNVAVPRQPLASQTIRADSPQHFFLHSE